MGGLLAAGQPDQAAGCAWNLGWAGWAEPCLGGACWMRLGGADRPGQQAGCWLGWAGAHAGLATRRSCFSGQKARILVGDFGEEM